MIKILYIAIMLYSNPTNVQSFGINRHPTNLEYAISYFRRHEWEKAIQSFFNAITNDDLNNAGKALSYWNISECWRELGNEDQIINALFMFIITAQDVLDEYDTRRYTVTLDGDFVKKFDLTGKLNYARSYINFTWITRSNYYGKSIEDPIIVHNIQELGYLIKLIKNQCKCEIQRGLLHENGILIKPYTERIIIDNKETFYIIIPERGD